MIEALGFSLAVWNGKGVSLQGTAGVSSRHVSNSVVLSFDDDEPLERAFCVRIVEAAIRAFDPDHVVVTSHELLDEHEAELPWAAGWLIWHRGQPMEEHPFPPARQR